MSLQKNLSFVLLGEDRSASSAMNHASSTASKVTGTIGGVFGKLGGVIGGEFGEVLNRVGEGITTVGEKTHSASAVMMGAGGVLTGLGVALQGVGSADKQASDQLQQAIKSSGHSFGDYKEEIEKTISTQENFGHSAVDTQTALRKLTTATGDPKKALEQMGLVANLAAAKHISLADASTLVTRVMAGKGGRTLAEYGITMGKSKDKAHDAEVALTQLSAKVNGQASASMDNFGAKVNAARTKLGDWVATMGNQFGPVLTVAGPLLMGAAAAMDIWKAANIGARIATIAGAVATGVATAAQWAWNVAMDANPIGIVILAITALVAAVVFLATHWKQVTAFVTTVWGGFLKWATAVVKGFVSWWNGVWTGFANWISDLWQNKIVKPVTRFFTLLFTGLKIIGTAISTWWNKMWYDVALFIITKWNDLRSRVVGFFTQLGAGLRIIGAGIASWWNGMWSAVGSFVGRVWSSIVGAVRTGVGFVHDVIVNVLGGIRSFWSSVWNGLGSVVRSVFNGIVAFLRPIVNTIMGIVGSVMNAIHTITGAASSAGSTSSSVAGRLGIKPHAALGGIVTRPTTLLAGESGPEAIIPLHYGANTPGLGGGGGDIIINLTVPNGFVGNEHQLAQALFSAFANGIKSGHVNPRNFKDALGVS